MLSSWKRLSEGTKRILTVLGIFLLLVMLTVAGALTPLSSEDADALNRELENMQQDVRDMDVLSSTVAIFKNNFFINAIMFVPIAGPFFGTYVLYNTGLMIGAQSTVNGISPLYVLFLLFFFPFTWMEFIAYSIALSQGVWLTWRIIQHKGKSELKSTLILIGACAAILLAAALIESIIILSLA
jgi:hypothetical protein